MFILAYTSRSWNKPSTLLWEDDKNKQELLNGSLLYHRAKSKWTLAIHHPGCYYLVVIICLAAPEGISKLWSSYSSAHIGTVADTCNVSTRPLVPVDPGSFYHVAIHASSRSCSVQILRLQSSSRCMPDVSYSVDRQRSWDHMTSLIYSLNAAISTWQAVKSFQLSGPILFHSLFSPESIMSQRLEKPKEKKESCRPMQSPRSYST